MNRILDWLQRNDHSEGSAWDRRMSKHADKLWGWAIWGSDPQPWYKRWR